MALTLTGANLVRQRTFGETRKPKIQAALKMLFSYIAQHKGSPDLQLVAISALSSTVAVVADVACRVHAIYLKKLSTSTTATYFKASDHATVISTTAPEFMVTLPTSNEELIVFGDGLSMANGFSIGAFTTASGATGAAAADIVNGFVILGGA